MCLFLFLDSNLSKCQWIFTKLGEYTNCIDFVKIWFGIAGWQILSKFDRVFASDTSIFSFLDDNFSKYQWIFTKLGLCIVIMEIWFGIADGQISSIFDRVICPHHVPIFISVQ